MSKNMKRVFAFGKNKSRSVDAVTETSPDPLDHEATPEANAKRNIKLFCDCGGPGNPNQADEVIFLPVIVDMCESSPAAAKEAIVTLRKQLDTKNSFKPYRQYNALMLLRILADNPGPIFTRNIDKAFVTTLKSLWRDGRDQSVRQLLQETLEHFDVAKATDPGLEPVREFWNKEKEQIKKYFPRGLPGAMPMNMNGQVAYSGAPPPVRRAPNQLPPVAELSARISEAQMSAKLLMQILQSTPQDEVLSNQLIREFADRCSAASRSVQQFIECNNPAPDESTLVTLFETNEQLAASLSRHQLAVYGAKQRNGGSRNPSRTNSGIGNQQPTAATTTSIPNNNSNPSRINSGGLGESSLGSSLSKPSQQLQQQDTPIRATAQAGPIEDPFRDPSPAVPILSVPMPPDRQNRNSFTGGSGSVGHPQFQQQQQPQQTFTQSFNPDHTYTSTSPQEVTPSQVPHGYAPYRY